MTSCDRAGELKSDGAAQSTSSEYALPRREMERLTKLCPSQRKHELSIARNRPLIRARKMLRCYQNVEASKPRLRNVLLIPIRIHDRESQVEKLLYRENGSKVRLVIGGTNEPNEEGPWQTKRDELERLCAKVGVPFLSAPRIAKIRCFLSLDHGDDASSVCGVIVSFGVRNVWDEFDALEQELSRAHAVDSLLRRLERKSANPEPHVEVSLTAKRRPMEADVSGSVKSTIRPLAPNETKHPSLTTVEAKLGETKRRQIDASHQPASAIFSQPEHAARLTVDHADDVEERRHNHATSLRDAPSNNDFRTRSEVASTPSDDDLEDGELEFQWRPTKVRRLESYASPASPKPTSEPDQTRSPVKPDALVLSEVRLQCMSNSCTSSRGSDHAVASRISRLEVEELLLESNLENLSRLTSAIDEQISVYRGKLKDLSVSRATAESRHLRLQEVAERESVALDEVELSLAQNHVRLAFLLSEKLPAQMIYLIQENLEVSPVAVQQSVFPCSSDDGEELEIGALLDVNAMKSNFLDL